MMITLLMLGFAVVAAFGGAMAYVGQRRDLKQAAR